MIKKYFAWILLSLSLILLLYVLYKSEFVWGGEKRDYYFFYYIFSISSIFFSLITFFLNDKLKEYILILIVTLFISAYAIEIYLSFNARPYFDKNNQKKINIYKKNTGKNYDERTKFEIYSDLKNKNVTLAVPPSIYLNKTNLKIFPLSTTSNTKTILCNENGYYSIYESDRYGFNNPDSEWDKKQTEYMLIGDSFAHGSCVNRPNDIASVLRSLSKKPVLNLGYAGLGPLMEYATLKEYLKPNVKNILWMYTEINDNEDLYREANNQILNQYLKDKNFSQNLKIKQKLINEMSRLSIENYIDEDKFKFKKYIKLSNVRTLLYNYYIPNAFKPNFKKIQKVRIPPFQLRKILRRVDLLSKKNNSNLYFVYVPVYYRYDKNFRLNNQKIIQSIEENYVIIKSLLKDLNIQIIDLHEEVLKKETKPLKLYPFEMFGHMNEEGYRKFAETIYRSTLQK